MSTAGRRRTTAGLGYALVACSLFVSFVPALAEAPRARESRTIRDSENRFQLAVGTEWTAATAPEGSMGLHYFRGHLGESASITRFDAANRSAFRKDQRESFFDDIERGLAASTPGFRSRQRSHHKVARTPILDLEFTRRNVHGDSERVWMRMLFRYRYTIVATGSVAATAPRRTQRYVRAFVQGLEPQVAR